MNKRTKMSSEEYQQTVSHKGEKRRKFTLQFKSSVVEYALSASNREAARKFDVDEKRVREWRANNEKLNQLKSTSQGAKRMRLEGGGRKITNFDVEEQLLEWIHERRANSLRVSRKLITCKAKALHDDSVEDDHAAQEAFVASRGWLEKFTKRNCLSLRRSTTTI